VADISLIGRNDHQRTDEVYICGDGLLTTEGDGAIVLFFFKKKMHLSRGNFLF
jgi:hypothetical protein